MKIDQAADASREAFGIFHSASGLQDAIDDLLSSGFDRSELSLLASEHAVDEKLGHRYARVDVLADDAEAPRAAFVSTEAIGDAEGGIIGGLVYVGAIAAVGAVVATGGTLLAAIMRSTLRSRLSEAACCYGCERGIEPAKSAPSRFSEDIRRATSTSICCRLSWKRSSRPR
jgi:hypothetical protein